MKTGLDHWLLKYLLPLNLFFDVFSFFFTEGGLLAIVRGFLSLALVAYFIISGWRMASFFWPVLLFVGYLLLNLVFCSDLLYSAQVSSKIIITVSNFIIGFVLVGSIERLKKLSMSIIIVYIMLIANFIISNVFKLGASSYTDAVSFYNGSLRDNWNLLAYSVLLAPLVISFLQEKPVKRQLVFVLAFLNGLFTLLSLKRIAIAGLVFGMGLNGLVSRAYSKFVSYLIPVVLLAAMAFPLYEEVLLKRFESREDRFTEGAIEEEGRYQESIYVWEEVLAFEDPIKSIFGLEAFNSVGNYAGGRFGPRQLHVDYNLIVNTIGLVGFSLYLFMFVHFWTLYRKYKTRFQIPEGLYRQMKSTFTVLFFTQFITSSAGQMYSLTFRSIIFLFLGAICSVFVSHYFKHSSFQHQKKLEARKVKQPVLH